MEPMTEVIFRKERSGSFKGHIIAVFPYVLDNYNNYTMSCYAHVGQHSGCSLPWYLGTVPAKADEYQSLYDELIRIGYNLKVVKRINYDRQRLEFKIQNI